ncbi:MAG TPA: ADP-ribosylglycohydrolase family protein [bacterium]|nr:ADP-ribosylglycohydrolase family protein [bacterium]
MKWTRYLPGLLILFLLFTGCERPEFQEISATEMRDKIYASWVGQIIGNIYGLPHENDYIEEPGPANFPYGYRGSLERLKEVNGAFSDDDTDIEYIYLLQMEEYGPEPEYSQLAEAWLYHIRERVWLANRAALGLMHFGYEPPVTGWKPYNPHWFQIDPQLVNEVWGVTAPGMVNYAAQKSDWAARVTNDGWGVEPTIHYGAMYAAAFFESDVRKLIDIGTAALPENSRFAETVEDMKRLYEKYPADWRAARKEMADKYYHNEPVDTKTIWNANLNGACGILALLYGDGDFQKTLDLSCAIGFDADNQAATMAGLLGAAKGFSALPENLLYPPGTDWDEPFNDFYKNVSRYDMPDASISDMADRMLAQAEKIIVMHGGEKVNQDGGTLYRINKNAHFFPPLELPAAPAPYIEIGKPVDYQFTAVGGQPPYHWEITEGEMPPGLKFRNGEVTGKVENPGIWEVTVRVSDGDRSDSRPFRLIVHPENIAPDARQVLASVRETAVEVRDAMWLTVPYSLYANEVTVLNDGVEHGDGSTFYSITDSHEPRKDYYGYEWDSQHTIGLIGFHTGSMEENGGWFTSLNAEYQDETGEWFSVDNLRIVPSLLPGQQPYNKPHFVEYLLAFSPVQTKAIRIIGQAGSAPHWRNGRTPFTSITELKVHGNLPDYRMLDLE